LQKVNIDLLNGLLRKNTPRFSAISARINKSGDEKYKAHFDGNLESFEVSNSEFFLGSLPASKFTIDLDLNTAISKLEIQSEINLNGLEKLDIYGFAELNFSSEQLMKMKCEITDCELFDLNFSYQINLDDEWVRGSAVCPQKNCTLMAPNYLVRTSNTANVFTIVNEANILNPLTSMYLYGVITSGQKINSGHELKLQF